MRCKRRCRSVNFAERGRRRLTARQSSCRAVSDDKNSSTIEKVLELTTPDDAPWTGPGVLTVFLHDFATHEGLLVTGGGLHETRHTSRQIMDHLRMAHAK